LLAVVVLMLTSPGVGDIVRDVVAAACDATCQDDDGCERSALGCLRSCAHCGCCAHSTTAPVPAELALLPPAPAAGAASWLLERRRSNGYRAPPFRPPLTSRAGSSARFSTRAGSGLAPT
jgi:hypothetical protein